MVKLEKFNTKELYSKNPPASRGVGASHAINIDLNYSSVIGNCGGGVLREKWYSRTTPPSASLPPPLRVGEIFTARATP